MDAKNPTCKCCDQAEIWKRNWQNFDLSKEGKYRSANQATLQTIPDKIRIISFYSYNNIAIRGSSNLFINQKVSQLNSVTRMSWNCGRRIHMFNLGRTRSPKYQYFPCPHSNNTWRLFSSKVRSHSVYPSHPSQGFNFI